MDGAVTLLALSGSTRSASHNLALVKVAAAAARRAGAEVELIDLRNLALPLYDADLEAELGLPDGAVELKRHFKRAHGFLIATPEYNGSLSAVLKNAIDWVSRPEAGETPFTLSGLRGKVAGIMATSPGAWGGFRGLTHLRQILADMGVLVAPEQIAVPAGHDAFDDAGELKNPAHKAAVESIARRVVQLAHALRTGQT